MKVLSSREEVLGCVREWVNLLAQQKFEAAFEMLMPSEKEFFSPQILQQLTANYGQLEPRSDGLIFSVTPWEFAVCPEGRAKPYQDVEWYEASKIRKGDPVVGDVHFDVPLNGEWSDLTAVFWIHAIDGGFALELERIEIL